MFSLRPRLLVLALGSILIAPALLAEDMRYNQVSLRAEVSRDVAHDRMHVTLYAEQQDARPAELATRITRQLNEALQRSRAVPAVDSSLGSRSSQPVYDDKGRRIIAWRERAELRLESADFAALARLTGQLQDTLQLAGMQFSLSPGSRRQHEEQLLREVVSAFKARAGLISAALDAPGYRLVRLDLHSQAAARPMVLRAMAASAAEPGLSPQIEAGHSTLQVLADGVIEVDAARSPSGTPAGQR